MLLEEQAVQLQQALALVKTLISDHCYHYFFKTTLMVLVAVGAGMDRQPQLAGQEVLVVVAAARVLERVFLQPLVMVVLVAAAAVAALSAVVL